MADPLLEFRLVQLGHIAGLQSACHLLEHLPEEESPQYLRAFSQLLQQWQRLANIASWDDIYDIVSSDSFKDSSRTLVEHEQSLCQILEAFSLQEYTSDMAVAPRLASLCTHIKHALDSHKSMGLVGALIQVNAVLTGRGGASGPAHGPALEASPETTLVLFVKHMRHGQRVSDGLQRYVRAIREVTRRHVAVAERWACVMDEPTGATAGRAVAPSLAPGTGALLLGAGALASGARVREPTAHAAVDLFDTGARDPSTGVDPSLAAGAAATFLRVWRHKSRATGAILGHIAAVARQLDGVVTTMEALHLRLRRGRLVAVVPVIAHIVSILHETKIWLAATLWWELVHRHWLRFVIGNRALQQFQDALLADCRGDMTRSNH